MKSALLVARTDAFITLATEEAQDCALRDDQLTVNPDVDLVRITKEGVGTMLIELLDRVAEWEWREPLRAEGISGTLHGYLVSCRNEEFFCCVVRSLALRLSIDLWVIDSEDSVFAAASVRPELVRL